VKGLTNPLFESDIRTNPPEDFQCNEKKKHNGIIIIIIINPKGPHMTGSPHPFSIV
jgi:hypothetical protein